MNVQISPSLMCMNFLHLQEQITCLNTRADYFHVDIMDGHFVKNLALSTDFVKAIAPIAKLPLDCHLMVTDPADYVDPLIDAGAEWICMQSETIVAQAFRLIDHIHARGKKAGVVLSPETLFDAIRHYVNKVDKITVMTVDPGFAGQNFIAEMLDKIAEIRAYKEKTGAKFLIEVDGSCNKNTYQRLRAAGAEILIVGSSGLFGLDKNLEKAWEKMAQIYEEETGESLCAK